ncbi:MAG TPA: YegS/Rv2252/BmrU family lipid kinase [Propionibacteriaceae bacterium]|nr:YegS/Rv2252/BmrU family lipid kinase [Propionibacteriaceae bacterium]
MTGLVPREDVALIVNGFARRGARAYEPARRALREAGIQLRHSVLVSDPGQIAAEVGKAVAAGCQLLVVGGGDGTIGGVAGLLADLPPGSRPVLGALPLGTANDFARTLDLAPDLASAVTALATGKVVDIDLGRANGRPMLNVASIGLSVEATRALRPRLKRWLGPAAYPLSVLAAYRRHRPFRARLEFPDGDFAPLDLGDLLQVAVANGRHYGGGNTVAPDAGIDDSTLDVYAIRAGRLRDHLSLARLLRDGTLIEHERVQHLITRSVVLTTDEPQVVNVDGELAAVTPVEFEAQSNAIEVAVPAHVTHLHYDAGSARARLETRPH